MRTPTTSPLVVRSEMCGLTNAVEAKPLRKSLRQEKAATVESAARTASARSTCTKRDLFGRRAVVGAGGAGSSPSEDVAAGRPGVEAALCEPESPRTRVARPEPVS